MATRLADVNRVEMRDSRRTEGVALRLGPADTPAARNEFDMDRDLE